ncbi:MAG: phosphoribosyltransferase family protein [Phenylobacterium sp.]
MSSATLPFPDRAEAGRLLGELLAARHLKDPIVYALPRGGVPVAVEVARRLKAPIDLVLVRKIGAPGYPELALGAVADGEAALTVLNPDVVRMTEATQAYVDRIRGRELAEIERRRALYLGDRPRPDPRGRTVIVVDDGLATGATARAAAEALRAHGAARIIVAAPVAAPDTVAALQASFDEVVCVAQPEDFRGVGAFYRDFHQLTDKEVVDLMRTT